MFLSHTLLSETVCAFRGWIVAIVILLQADLSLKHYVFVGEPALSKVSLCHEAPSRFIA